MGRLSNTWKLTKVSWSLLKKDRELLWLPVISGLVIVALILVLLVLSFVTGGIDVDEGSEGFGGIAVVLGIVFAFAATGSGVFFEGALVAGAYDRMTGGDPTVRSAIGKAAVRLPSLLGWAIVSATVGMLLRALEQRLPSLARILLWFVEAAWSIATYLVVPAIMIDDYRPIASIKHSASLVRRTWGENIISQAGFGLLGFLLMLPAILVGVVIAVIVPGIIGTVIGGAIGLAGVVTVAVVISALSVYFKTALYVYATDGNVLGGFEGDQMRDTFRAKRQR